MNLTPMQSSFDIYLVCLCWVNLRKPSRNTRRQPPNFRVGVTRNLRKLLFHWGPGSRLIKYFTANHRSLAPGTVSPSGIFSVSLPLIKRYVKSALLEPRQFGTWLIYRFLSFLTNPCCHHRTSQVTQGFIWTDPSQWRNYAFVSNSWQKTIPLDEAKESFEWLYRQWII